MGLFGKKKKEVSEAPNVPEFPRIPEPAPSYQPEFQKKFPPENQGPLPARSIPASPRDVNPTKIKGMHSVDPSKEFLKNTGLPPIQDNVDDLANPMPESQQGLLPESEPYPATRQQVQGIPGPRGPQGPPGPPGNAIQFHQEDIHHEEQMPQPQNYEDRLSKPMQHHEETHHHPSGEKPLFIKIDEYKEALRNLDMLRSKIEEIEDYVARLESIKAAEDDEIRKCKENMAEMKKSLIDIDHRLFEV